MPEHPEPPIASGPLAGLRVIDCSTVLAGPYCTMLLGDLGVDVIKVEPPEGDASRGWGPPWVGDASDGTRTAAYFLAVNRNKRSIRLDLHRPAGADVLRRLLADGDVLVENFRSRALERLGFGEAELQALNPQLVHLAITGYSAASPDPGRPGYDFVIQAESGLMSITGAADEVGGQPTKVGVAISDVVAGLQGAVAILAALVGR
jgi:crotonobetainyl-CoA:carnitine CoA-transferase CaiB-like acyl-CoA transferase